VFFRSAHMLPAEKQARGEAPSPCSHNDQFAALVDSTRASTAPDIPRAVLVANFFSDLHYLPQWYSADGPKTAPSRSSSPTCSSPVSEPPALALSMS
jgi:hypothetical protein